MSNRFNNPVPWAVYLWSACVGYLAGGVSGIAYAVLVPTSLTMAYALYDAFKE